MKKDLKKIIHLLSKDSWTSSSELAKALAVSSRQIRKYIRELKEIDENLIESSYYGYRLKKMPDILHKNSIEFSGNTRTTYIIQKLIILPQGIHVYDLCDEMFISETTLENDLKKVKRILSEFNLQIKREHGNILLIGNEQKKRKLMNHLLSGIGSESIKFGSKLSILQGEYNVSNFNEPIHKILEKNQLIADEYAFNNIIFHLIITIDRIRSENNIDDLGSFVIDPNDKRKCATLEISEFIKNTFNLILNNAELTNLYIIIIGNTRYPNSLIQNDHQLEFALDDQYVQLSKSLLYEVSSIYYLDAFPDSFILQFAIHISNMLDRIKKGYIAKNPMTLTIKENYPLIYDISVFLARNISKTYNVIINEAEITFISFHIGGYLENHIKLTDIVSCAFVYSKYLQLYMPYINKIIERFSNQLLVTTIISSAELKALPNNLDFIISTIPLSLNVPVAVIKPFADENDFVKIKKYIMNVQNNKKINNIINAISSLFHYELFLIDPKFNNREEAIIHMSKNVIHLGYADDALTDDILQREKMSSTTYGEVAIPHSLHHTKKSFISVAIVKDGLYWENKKIKIIFMLGIQKEERKVFSQTFDYLVEVLYNASNVTKLCNQSSYENFVSILIEMIRTTQL